MSNARHPIRRPAASWLLLVLFMLGTATPAVSRMTCLQSGHSEVSVGYAEECCPEEAPTQGAAVKPVCCEVLTTEPTKHPFASHGAVVVPVQDMDGRVLPLGPVCLVEWTVKPRSVRTNGPPRTRLAAMGAFRL
jgi:hypothetical protein